jgi:hypothetical protein
MGCVFREAWNVIGKRGEERSEHDTYGVSFGMYKGAPPGTLEGQTVASLVDLFERKDE